jgi:Trk K+ transport system NAD-binding subunit
MYRAIYAILTGQHLAHLDEINIIYHQKLVSKKIGDLNFREHKLLCIGLQAGVNGKFIFNPPCQLRLQEEDIILIMGRKVSIEHFKELYKEIKYVKS